MTAKIRLNLSDAVLDLAPKEPPCFAHRPQWIEYLKSAAAAQCHSGEPKVIIYGEDQPKFNPEFDFCLDCESMEHREYQRRQGTCKPGFLKGSDDQ